MVRNFLYILFTVFLDYRSAALKLNFSRYFASQRKRYCIFFSTINKISKFFSPRGGNVWLIHLDLSKIFRASARTAIRLFSLGAV